MFILGSITVFAITGLVFLAKVVFKRWVKTKAMTEVGEVVQEVYPVWAALGPFDSGVESARAMRYAFAAVIGPVEAMQMLGEEPFVKHAQSFDSSSEWETLRQGLLKNPRSKTDEHTKTARMLLQYNFLNDLPMMR